MRLGFSTNSIGDIPPLEALPILRDLGYSSLAVTLDHHLLNPFAAELTAELARWQAALATNGMGCVIETGSRHLLDPLRKHEPTLVSARREDRLRRVDFLVRAIDVAKALNASCMSLWAGVVHDSADEESVWLRLTDGLAAVLDHAAARGVAVGFEPEPGMFVDTLARHRLLLDRLDRPEHLKLTLDIGHLECMGERPAADVLRPRVKDIVNVHVEDMLACRHEHLPLGSGDIDFAPIFQVLATSGYTGGIHVELPRQSHRWHEMARQAADFLASVLPQKTYMGSADCWSTTVPRAARPVG